MLPDSTYSIFIHRVALVIASIAITTSICLARPIPTIKLPNSTQGQFHKKVPDSKIDLTSNWITSVQKDIQQREYHFSFGPANFTNSGQPVWQAPNRKHNLRIYADTTGVSILERQGKAHPLLRLETVRVGRVDTPGLLDPGVLAATGNRLEIQRANLIEWYVNSPSGIEQGYTITDKPPGTGNLSLELSCGQQPIMLDNGHLLFSAVAGRPLNYEKLIVTDADHKRIPARFTVTSQDHFSIQIDDQEASYPLTIDPVITSTFDSLLIGGQHRAEFGSSVSSVGDFNGDGYGDMVVGARFHETYEEAGGAIFLYLGTKNGISQDPAGQVVGANFFMMFGTAVSGAGDINGDGYDDFIVNLGVNDAHPSNNRVYVYFGTANVQEHGIAETSIVLNGDAVDSDWFGRSISGAGDVNGDGYADIIIGAPKYNADQGLAYVYYGSSGGLQQYTPQSLAYQQYENQLPVHPKHKFGATVSGGGDINGDGYADVLVATDRDDAATANAVYVYYGSSSGISNYYSSSETVDSPQNDSQFGAALAAAGDLNGDGYGDVAIGTPGFDADSLTDQGAVSFHFGSSGGLSTTLPVRAFKSADGGAHLGDHISGGGDLNGDGYGDVIVSAPGYYNSGSGDGAIFIYHGTSAGVLFSSHLLNPGSSSDMFASNIALARDINNDGFDDIISGADNYYNGLTSFFSGAVYLYHGSALPVSNIPVAFLESNQANAVFGAVVSGAGDFNGDGYDDIIIGAPSFDKGNGNRGMAFLYFGPPDSLWWPFPLQFGGDANGREFGRSVSGAGDVNGDGYADVVVGDPNGYYPGARAYIYYGDAFFNYPPETIVYEADSSNFGSSVSGAGDVNGDGFSDIVISESGYDSERGRVFVYHGSKTGLSTKSSTVIEGNTADAMFGSSVSGAGDVNGDGYSDIVVGSQDYTNGETHEGAVFVYRGSRRGVSASYSALLESNRSSAFLGRSVSGAGDINGDGFDDIIAGASGYENGEPGEGAGFLYLGSITGLINSAPAILEGDEPYANYGYGTSGAGDVNGDGFDDLLIGGFLNRAILYFGNSNTSGADAMAPVTFQSPQFSSGFGSSLSGAGDINGDGFADVLIGAGWFNNGEVEEGAAFIFLGNGNGRPVKMNFLRTDSEQPIAPRGLSYDSSGFLLRMDLHSPRGKEEIRLETLVCPEVLSPPTNKACKSFISPWWIAMPAFVYKIDGLSPGLYNVKSRLAYAPYSSIRDGIIPPHYFRHGPWRYLNGNTEDSVIRVGLDPSQFPWAMFLPAIIGNQE